MGVILIFYGKKAQSKEVDEVVEFCRENGIKVIDAKEGPA